MKKVDDDDGDDFPSPEPKMDSRSALQMKNRWWRRLRIENATKTSLFYFFWDERQLIELELGRQVHVGPTSVPTATRGWWRSRGLWPTSPPPEVELGVGIFDIFQNCSP